MKLNKNDPKLTAFVLNELPAHEMKQVAEEIKNNPDLQLEVKRLQENVLNFKKLKDPQTVRLNMAQREKIFAQIQPASTWSKYFKLAGGLTVASLALVLYVKNESDLKSAAKFNSNESLNAYVPEPEPQAESNPGAQDKTLNATAEAFKKPAVPEPQEQVADLAAAKPAAAAADTAKSESPSAPEPVEESRAATTAATDSAGTPNAFVAEKDSAEAVGAGGGAYLQKKKFAPKLAQNANALSARTSMQAASSGGGGGLMMLTARKSEPATLEMEHAVIQIIDLSGMNAAAANALLKPLSSCFENSISRYSRFHIEADVYWTIHNGEVQSSGYSTNVLAGTQAFTEEHKCIEPALRSATKADPLLNRLSGNQRVRLILRSK